MPPKKYYEKLKFAEKHFAENFVIRSLDEPDEYPYHPHTDEQLRNIADNRANDPRVQAAIKINKYLDELASKNNDFHTWMARDGHGNEMYGRHLAYFLDYHYMTTSDPEYAQRIHQQNEQIYNKLQDPAEYKKLLEKGIRDILTIDMSMFTKGTEVERFQKIYQNIHTVSLLFTGNDFIKEYEKIKDHNPGLIELYEEKKTEFQMLGGYLNYIKKVPDDLMPLLEDRTTNEIVSLSLDLPPAPVLGKGLKGEELQISNEFHKLLKEQNVTRQSKEDLEAEAEIYNILADLKIVDTADDAVRYYPVDDEDEKLSLEDAIKRMAGQPPKTVKFIERSQEEVDHLLYGKEEPEQKTTGREVVFNGRVLDHITDAPNPVASGLEEQTPEEQKLAANKWFESLVDTGTDFDFEDKFETFRLQTFELDGVNRRNVEIENVNKVDTSQLDAAKFIFGTKPLSQYTAADKVNLYNLAREGKLVLLSANMNPMKAQTFYVKDDGTAGLSQELAKMSTENGQLNLHAKEDPDYYKKMFPGAKNAKELCTQYGDFMRAQAFQSGINAETDDVTYAHDMVTKQWTASIKNDIATHPEFYVNPEMAKARGDHLAKYVQSSFSGINKEWENIGSYSEQHPVSYYEDTENLLNTVIASTEKLNNYSINDLIKGGLISYGNKEDRNQMFIQSKNGSIETFGDQPWEALDRINNEIISGGNVYVSIPNDEYGLTQYKLVQKDEEIKLKETVPLKQYQDALKDLTALRDSVNETGVTRGDSQEFKSFKDKLNALCTSLPDTKVDFEKEMGELETLSFRYSFAKLDESHNSRRGKRFDLANKTRNLAHSLRTGEPMLSDAEMYKRTIAEKSSKNFLNKLAKSKNPQSALLANNILNSPRNFESQIKSLMNTDYFKNLYDGRDAKSLETVSKQSASSLNKLLLTTKSDPKMKNHQYIDRVMAEINSNNLNTKNTKTVFGSPLKEEGPNNPYKISSDRSGLISLAGCILLEQGKTVDEILDNTKCVAEKQQAFRQASELVKEKNDDNSKTIARLFHTGGMKALEFFNTNLKNVDMSDPKWIITGDNKRFITAATFLVDCFQEGRHVENEFFAQFGGKEQHDKIASYETSMAAMIGFAYDGLRCARNLEKGDQDREIDPDLIGKSMLQSIKLSELFMSQRAKFPEKNPTELFEKFNMTGFGFISLSAGNNTELDEILREEETIKLLGKGFLDGTISKECKIDLDPMEENPAIPKITGLMKGVQNTTAELEIEKKPEQPKVEGPRISI